MPRRKAPTPCYGAVRLEPGWAVVTRPALFTLGVFLCGCASTSAAPAFRDTAKLVEGRTGHRIFWNQGGVADDAVARRGRELLDREM